MRSINPAISVVVPAYNVSKYIKLCIDSILGQTFQNFELIVVDDASVDDTCEICQKLYGHVNGFNLIKNTANMGAGYSRNVGIDQAEGKYIFFMDSDDELLPWALETLYLKAEEEQADIVHTNLWFGCYSEGHMISRNSLCKLYKSEKLEVGVYRLGRNVEKRVATLLEGLMPMTCLNIFRREFLNAERIRFPQMSFEEDHSFNIEACLKAKTYVRINEPLFIYRLYYNQKNRTVKRSARAFPHASVMISQYNKIFSSFTEEELPAVARRCYIEQILRYYVEQYVYMIMDTNDTNDFDTIERNLRPLCGEGSEFVAYLLSMLGNALDIREKIFAEREQKLSSSKQFFAELATGKCNYAKNYSYIYSEAKLAVYTEGGDDEFYGMAYETLADAALELCKYQEAVDAYDKAASYTQSGSDKFLQIARKKHDAEQYIEDTPNMVNLAVGSRKAARDAARQQVELTADNRCITFGTIVHYKQITDGMIELWLEILERVPDSKLLIKSYEFAEEAMMVEAGERFLDAGINLKRLYCKGVNEDVTSECRGIDVFLGTYPVQDAKIIHDVLHTGTPAVVLDGKSKDAQTCKQLMSNMGLTGLMADSGEEYIKKAVELASNLN